jgi:hypothetical protein
MVFGQPMDVPYPIFILQNIFDLLPISLQIKVVAKYFAKPYST